jgi:uncharacterized DUF497 family protein
MEFDWLDAPFDLKALTPRAIEESFEDPFSLRLLPDTERSESRYFNLGRSAEGRAIFSVFWTDGKSFRVIAARPMTRDEENFFDRKNDE